MKFRAECQLDVARLIVALTKHLAVGYHCQITAWRHLVMDNSIEVTVKTNLSRKKFIKLMRRVPDSHVMIETLAIEAEYTGNRVPV